MAEEDGVQIPDVKGKGNQKNTSSGTRSRSSKGVEQPPEGAVEWLFTALEQHGEDIDIPFFEEDADRELTEAELDAFGLEDGTNLSVESLFDVASEREYVGDPTVEKEWFETEEEAEEYADEHDISSTQVKESAREEKWYVNVKLSDREGTDSIDRHAKIELGYGINGYYAEDIVEQFGEDNYIRVGMGARGLYDDGEEQAKHLRFKTTETENAEEKRKRAKVECEEVEFSSDDLDEWLEEQED